MKLYSTLKSIVAIVIMISPMIGFMVMAFFFFKDQYPFGIGLMACAIYFALQFANFDYYDNLEDHEAIRPYIRPTIVFTILSGFVTLGPASLMSWLGWI
jgi:hypothetical protein